jgi:hypothetical protein
MKDPILFLYSALYLVSIQLYSILEKYGPKTKHYYTINAICVHCFSYVYCIAVN